MKNYRNAKDQTLPTAMSTLTTFRSSACKSPHDEYVCWSRMQAEAGQTLEAIVARKERERRAGGGTFLWGVGNAPAVITNTLARAGLPVRVIFSIMKSRPKSIDSAPARIAAWRSYIDVCGVERRLPPQALVTSRADSASGPKKFHYALMCHSSEPLVLRSDRERFDPSAFRNAGGTGAAVGASQVTALLRRVDRDTSASDYQVNLSAWLTGGYWVRLTDPIELTVAKQALFTRLNDADEAEWVALVAAILEGPQSHLARGGDAVLLI